MSEDSQDKPSPPTRSRRKAGAAALPVGLGRQALAPRVEAWGLVVDLTQPVASPVPLNKPQAAKLGRLLVEALYPAKAQREALAKAGQVLAMADGLMSADSFLHDEDIRQELEELRAYLARMLPAAPQDGERRTPWMTLADCFHATDRSSDTAAFATGLYDEPDSVSLCLPFFRAHFEHQGPQFDPFVSVFSDEAGPLSSAALHEALAQGLGLASGDIRQVAMVPLHRAAPAGVREPDGDEASLAFGSAGHEEVLFTLAQQDKHQLDDCRPGEELARALNAMRAQAADEQAIQYGWRRGAAVAVKPSGEVLLGYATVDEMGEVLRGAVEELDGPGARVASRWQRWLLGHYIPLLQEILQAGFTALAFSAPAAAKRLATAAGRSAGGLRHELPVLEAVVAEHSGHASGDPATGVHAQAWRCLALREEPQPDAKARIPGHGEAFLLCVVVRVLDEEGRLVQQTNLFHTTPFAADVLKDSAEHHAKQLQLALDWHNTLLQVGDDLRLVVREEHEIQVNPRAAWKPASQRRDH